MKFAHKDGEECGCILDSFQESGMADALSGEGDAEEVHFVLVWEVNVVEGERGG